ncbi:hypothetical protein ON010_g12491 [Phytophthora cinnamomi]|nr:hypothetical protein ON010_g12491 [Phytophthora cinnamomi]
MGKGQQERVDWVLELLEDDDEDCTLLTTILPVQPHLNERSKPGGFRPGRAANKHRDPRGRTARLIAQYFADQPVYDVADFRHRFRMTKPDATGKPGIPGLLKVAVALRVFAHACSDDFVDENLEIFRPSILTSL